MIQLTPKEKEAVYFLADGLTQNDIAAMLKVKCETIQWRLSQARKKLGIKTNHQLVVAVLTLNRLNKQ